MKSEWTIDLKAGTAKHRGTGLVLATDGPDDDGGWDFRAKTIPPGLPADAQLLARLAREGGEAFCDAMRIDPDTLAACGRALFGDRWQSALAEELGVNRRTILRWLSGEWAVSAYVRPKLRDMIRRRGEECRALMERL